MVKTKNSPKSNAQEDYKYLARKPYNTIKNLRVTQESWFTSQRKTAIIANSCILHSKWLFKMLSLFLLAVIHKP